MIYLEVHIWGELVGVLAWDKDQQITSFEYAPSFLQRGWELSPLVLPLSKKVFRFDARQEQNTGSRNDIHKGLPLFIADALPDRFGTELLTKYLALHGKKLNDLSPIEKLSYLGDRAMGALEFRPSAKVSVPEKQLDIQKLSELSAEIIHESYIGNLEDMASLFHVGTSPGGAQPKVLINMNRTNQNLYRGDRMPKENEDSWIVKFNKDIGLDSDNDRGKVEFVYSKIAALAGIKMMPSQLLEKGSDSFFMTQRFDRQNGEKFHTQTLHAMAGMHFQLPNTYSYEQVFSVFNQLHLPYSDKRQLFRIMVFNLIGRNVDDHTKNFSFYLTRTGEWRFCPAYDLTFTYNQNYGRTTPHFLSIKGKNEKQNLQDVLAIAKTYGIKKPKDIINQVNKSFWVWPKLAQEYGVTEERINYIKSKLLTLGYGVR